MYKQIDSTLYKTYMNSIVPKMSGELGVNIHEMPEIEKIVVNSGLKKAVKDSNVIKEAVEDIGQITGQKPVITRAKKSIAGFNLRKGDICGVFVTLRRDRMYEFLDRMITVALPRVRDFSGLSPKSVDGRGSYTIGVREQIIFPEVDYNTIYKVRGMNVTIVTTGKTPEETLALLREMGLPIREE